MNIAQAFLQAYRTECVQIFAGSLFANLFSPHAHLALLNCDADNMVRGGDLAVYHDKTAMYTMENAQFVPWPPVEGVMTATPTTGSNSK
jgi:hypothetical protein